MEYYILPGQQGHRNWNFTSQIAIFYRTVLSKKMAGGGLSLTDELDLEKIGQSQLIKEKKKRKKKKKLFIL